VLGQTIPHYLIIEKPGHGGMCEVLIIRSHPHLMLLLPITSNTDKRWVMPRSCRIGFPMLKSSKVQPADFADTYSRTSVPRPELSM
jgi:hypothetical protein